MPQWVKKIIHFNNIDNARYIRIVWKSDKPVLYQFPVGDTMKKLVPKGARVDTDESDVHYFPLFNKMNHTRIIEDVGQYGMIHIGLVSGKYLKKIYIEPEGVTICVIPVGDQRLVYEFYNPTTSDIISITATLENDHSGIYTKIKSKPDDLEFQQYLLRQALNKGGSVQIKIPDLMTAEQVAKYLQISVQTVRNKTSSGELKSYRVAGVLRYKKEDLTK